MSIDRSDSLQNDRRSLRTQRTRNAPGRDPADHLGSLLARCARGEQAAFLSLYEATSGKLYAIALGILKRDAWAEEALQEAYLKVWTRADSYNANKGRPMTWLINIVRNQALDLIRKPQYSESRSTQDAPAEFLIAEDDPEAMTETTHGLARISACLRQLDERQRRCILLAYHHGFTPTEIARREGWPVATVKTWLRRGVLRIREQLQPARAGAEPTDD